MLRELFGKENLEKKIEANEKKFKELLDRVAEIDNDTVALFQELDVTPAQIHSLLSNQDNFTAEAWQEVQKQMAELEQQLSAKRDITQVRQAYKERSEVRRDWIFVR